MVNYVETATLRINDQSTRKLRTINRQLDTMRKNIRTLATDTRKLTSEMRKLDGILRTMNTRALSTGADRAKRMADQIGRVTRAGRSFRMDTSSINTGANRALALRKNLEAAAKAAANVKVGRINVPLRGAGAPAFIPGLGLAGGRTFGDGVRGAFQARQVGRDMGRAFTFFVSNALFRVGADVGRTAANAPLNLDDARARVRTSGRTADELSLIENFAEDLSSRFTAVTVADIIANSGEVTGRFGDLTDPVNFEKAAKSMERLARNTQILDAALPQGSDPANQARLIEAAIQQTGTTSDPVAAQRISEAVIDAVIASGGDLKPGEVKRALQQLPTALAGISDDTLRQILLSRDETGRRGTGNFNQAFSDLTRGSLNKDDKALQIAAGIRNKDGTSDVFNALQKNFLEGIQSEIIPRLEKLGVDITDAGAVRAALDTQLGFSKEGGITAITGAIINLKEALAEDARAQKANPEFALDNKTVRQELRSVGAQFQNVAAQALEPLLPTVKTGLKSISDSLSTLQAGENLSVAQLATVGAAAVPLGIAASLQATLDPATRPLGTAGLALSGAAGNLTLAATALSGAAGVNALQGGGGGGGGGDGDRPRRPRSRVKTGVAVVGGAGLLAGLTALFAREDAADKATTAEGRAEIVESVTKPIGAFTDNLLATTTSLINAGVEKLTGFDAFANRDANRPENQATPATANRDASLAAVREGVDPGVESANQVLQEFAVELGHAKTALEQINAEIATQEQINPNAINLDLLRSEREELQDIINSHQSILDAGLQGQLEQSEMFHEGLQTGTVKLTQGLDTSFATGASKVKEAGDNFAARLGEGADIFGRRAAQTFQAGLAEFSVPLRQPAVSDTGSTALID